MGQRSGSWKGLITKMGKSGPSNQRWAQARKYSYFAPGPKQ